MHPASSLELAASRTTSLQGGPDELPRRRARQLQLAAPRQPARRVRCVTSGVDVPVGATVRSANRTGHSSSSPYSGALRHAPRRLAQQVARPRPRLLRAVHGRARRDDRERRAALDPEGPRALRGRPPVGRELLHADVRRLPAARRPRRRPARAQAPVPRRHRAVHLRVAARRARAVGHDAHPRPRPAGPGRRARLARRAVDHHHDLPGGRGAHQGARRVGRHRRRRRRVRPAARRHPHRPARLGVDLLRQRADRHRGPSCSPRARPRVDLGRRDARLRPRGRRHRHGRPRRSRLRHRQGAGVGLGLGRDARDRPAGRRAARRLRRHRAPLRRPARAARHLPHPHADRGQRRDAPRRLRAVRDVLLQLALRAGHPGLLAAQGRLRVPADLAVHRRRRRALPAAGADARRPDRRHRRPHHRGGRHGDARPRSPRTAATRPTCCPVSCPSASAWA